MPRKQTKGIKKRQTSFAPPQQATLLPMAQFTYNSSLSTIIGISLFEANTSTNPVAYRASKPDPENIYFTRNPDNISSTIPRPNLFSLSVYPSVGSITLIFYNRLL